MSDPYIGEIRMFGGSFAPAGWEMCNGQLLPISENDALFTLLGTTWGGDGQSTFGVPNLQSRIPVHVGPSNTLGELQGVEQVTLTAQQTPVHSHAPLASTANGNSSSPGDNIPAAMSAASGSLPYGIDQPFVNLDPSSVTVVGGSQPHDNMQPYLVVTFIISLFGIFPQFN
jgi:microcystin-dependent protein